MFSARESIPHFLTLRLVSYLFRRNSFKGGMLYRHEVEQEEMLELMQEVRGIFKNQDFSYEEEKAILKINGHSILDIIITPRNTRESLEMRFYKKEGYTAPAFVCCISQFKKTLMGEDYPLYPINVALNLLPDSNNSGICRLFVWQDGIKGACLRHEFVDVSLRDLAFTAFSSPDAIKVMVKEALINTTKKHKDIDSYSNLAETRFCIERIIFMMTTLNGFKNDEEAALLFEARAQITQFFCRFNRPEILLVTFLCMWVQNIEEARSTESILIKCLSFFSENFFRRNGIGYAVSTKHLSEAGFHPTIVMQSFRTPPFLTHDRMPWYSVNVLNSLTAEEMKAAQIREKQFILSYVLDERKEYRTGLLKFLKCSEKQHELDHDFYFEQFIKTGVHSGCFDEKRLSRIILTHLELKRREVIEGKRIALHFGIESNIILDRVAESTLDLVLFEKESFPSVWNYVEKSKFPRPSPLCVKHLPEFILEQNRSMLFFPGLIGIRPHNITSVLSSIDVIDYCSAWVCGNIGQDKDIDRLVAISLLNLGIVIQLDMLSCRNKQSAIFGRSTSHISFEDKTESLIKSATMNEQCNCLLRWISNYGPIAFGCFLAASKVFCGIPLEIFEEIRNSVVAASSEVIRELEQEVLPSMRKLEKIVHRRALPKRAEMSFNKMRLSGILKYSLLDLSEKLDTLQIAGFCCQNRNFVNHITTVTRSFMQYLATDETSWYRKVYGAVIKRALKSCELFGFCFSKSDIMTFEKFEKMSVECEVGWLKRSISYGMCVYSCSMISRCFLCIDSQGCLRRVIELSSALNYCKNKGKRITPSSGSSSSGLSPSYIHNNFILARGDPEFSSLGYSVKASQGSPAIFLAPRISFNSEYDVYEVEYLIHEEDVSLYQKNTTFVFNKKQDVFVNKTFKKGIFEVYEIAIKKSLR